jgi:uncharacterized protein involved in exopolysaccharide biosynthesis
LRRRLGLPLAVGVATAIIAAGAAYALVRPVNYESSGKVVLVPTAQAPGDLSSVLDSFERSGTAGTYVELIGSDDTLKQAGSPPVTLSVRSIPDTRAIGVSASSRYKSILRPALESILTTAQKRQTELNDPWTLKVIETPSSPSRTGPGTLLIVLASILLALLGAVAVLAFIGRLDAQRERVVVAAEPTPVAPGARVMRRRPRYPTNP